VRRLPSNSRASAALLVIALGAVQAPGYRLTYEVRVLERKSGEARVIATGMASGPEGTDLRLSLRSDTAEVDALLNVVAEPESAMLSGFFFGRRHAGRSRRGLPLWELDSYRRATRVAWGGVTHLYPFGRPRSSQARAYWLEIGVRRDFVGGETRPADALVVTDSSLDIALSAVVRPRRAVVRLTMSRGDTVSAPKVLDMVPGAASQSVTFVLGPGDARTLDIAMTRPAPPRTARDSALAPDADVVCLEVADSTVAEPPRARCGRLDNVARRIPLWDHDTLVATIAWPPAR